jgi:hypothetical protein
VCMPVRERCWRQPRPNGDSWFDQGSRIQGSVMSRTWVTRSLTRTTVVVLTAALVTGCTSVDSCSVAFRTAVSDLAIGDIAKAEAASASCVFGVEYRGRFYVAWSAELPVAKGHLLGDAVYPTCDDGRGGCGDDPEAVDRPTQVWAMRGVDPDRVVVARHEGSHEFVVFGRLHVDPRNYFRLVDGTWYLRDDPTRGQ